MKNKISQSIVVFLAVAAWLFGEFPNIRQNQQMRSFAQETAPTSTVEITNLIPEPPAVTEEVVTEEEKPEEGVSDAEITDLAPESSIVAEEIAIEDEEFEESVSEEITQLSESLSPQLSPLKERKLDKEVKIDKDARHSCAAKNFRIDVTGQNQIIAEFVLSGSRSDAETIEIGSLPLGIDITFLNNAKHEYSPKKKDNIFVLQIINQIGSQKGDFSIPIFYASGDKTTICQINVINMN